MEITKYINIERQGLNVSLPILPKRFSFDRVFVPTWLLILLAGSFIALTVSNLKKAPPPNNSAIRMVLDSEDSVTTEKRVKVVQEMVLPRNLHVSLFKDEIVLSKTIKDALKRDSIAAEKACLKMYSEYKLICDRLDIVNHLWEKTKSELIEMGINAEIVERYKPFELFKIEEFQQPNELQKPRISKKDKKLQFGIHNKTTAKEYIKLYKKLAKHHENYYGIPACITLAQGLHEANAGNSTLARKNNNHFGIKCFNKKCKKGHCTNHTDDTHKDFFRKYESAAQSYAAHSLLLQKTRYKALFKLKKSDYKGWCKGLKKAGYATDKDYAKKLIDTIELYKLNEL
jgi:flagellum-specific peptidoglycan hydrolase FlgJ